MDGLKQKIMESVLELVSSKTFFFLAGIVFIFLGVNEHRKDKKAEAEKAAAEAKQDLDSSAADPNQANSNIQDVDYKEV